LQVAENFILYGKYLKLAHALVIGGESMTDQRDVLMRGVDVLIATPGRLIDMFERGSILLSDVKILVIDEADRMLDMGFVHDVRRVVAALPKQRQTLFFSATIAPAVEALARGMLSDPVRVSIAPAVTTAERVEQSVLFVSKSEKRAVLERMLREGNFLRALVFTRTKHGANRLSEQLERTGIVSSAIHGNKSQGARERALEGFRRGTTTILVATDLAARGIDVDGVELVVNFDLPTVPESYVHRIGRTGRAGASGQAVTLCDPEERGLLADIERLIRQRIPVKAGADPREGNGVPRATAAREPTPYAGPPPASGAVPARQPHRYRGARIRPIY
jgi:ATP-dependent RNA helicase RhlE